MRIPNLLRTSLSLLALALPAAGAAQDLSACDGRASARNLPEPWDAPAVTRTFANGQVRLAILDTVEPAAAALHLLILSPPYDELNGRQCRILSAAGGMGFGGMTLEGMQAGYDPARGLIFSIPVAIFQPASGGFADATLGVLLNRATGGIVASVTR